MPGRLTDSVAIVTGAGSIGPGWGNGKAISVLFAREGANVFAVDINTDAARETVEIIRSEGGEAVAHQADVSNANEIETLVSRCVNDYGRVDIFHHNVGIVTLGGPVEVSEADWQRTISVNLSSCFYACKYPSMLH